MKVVERTNQYGIDSLYIYNTIYLVPLYNMFYVRIIRMKKHGKLFVQY